MASKTNESGEGTWLKLGEAAQELGVSEITLRRRVKSGRLPFDFKGGKYFVFIPSGADKNAILEGLGSDELATPVKDFKSQTTPSADCMTESSAKSLPQSPKVELSASSLERAFQAANILRPYAQVTSGEQGSLGAQPAVASKVSTLQHPSQKPASIEVKGPSSDQIVSILKIELQEKTKEIAELKRLIADQMTLISVLEAAYEELAGPQATNCG